MWAIRLVIQYSIRHPMMMVGKRRAFVCTGEMCDEVYICMHTIQGPIYSTQFSSSGKLLASGAADSTIRLWEPTARGEY